MYELIVTNSISGYIVDKSTKTILCCVETKRPELEFKGLRELIDKANQFDDLIVEKDDYYYSRVLLEPPYIHKK